MDLCHRLTIEKLAHRVETVVAERQGQQLASGHKCNLGPLIKMFEKEHDDMSMQLQGELSGNTFNLAAWCEC